MIDDATFGHIVESYIMPLLAGTALTKSYGVCTGYAVCNRSSTLKLSLTPDSRKKHCLLSLKRAQAFIPEEVGLARNIVDKWALAFSVGFHEAYYDVIAERCQVEAIVEFVDAPSRDLLLSLFEIMVDWTGQTYEGDRISFAVGVDDEATQGAPPLFENLREEDALKVMTSGHDTLLVCNRQGRIARHETLRASSEDCAPESDEADDQSACAPLCFLPVAGWARGGRYALCLNRNGEILVFKNARLIFIRRRGQWIFFTHSAYIEGMGMRGQERGTRRAVYQTMLDVSFKRSGGCIGLWHPARLRRRGDTSIAAADRLDGPEPKELSEKNRFLRRIIAGRKFQELSRKLRQELVSIDGATVVLYNGTILTVGAILTIEGGSTGGGGRTAAAKELAKKGVGVKISNDGKISYWMASAPEGKTDSRSLKRASPKYEIG